MNIRPTIWAPIRTIDPTHGASFDDFSWTMNKKAFDILKDLNITEVMKQAIDIKMDSGFTVQSPLIWSKIIKEHGIHIINAPTSGSISRGQAKHQNLVPFYGDTN